MNKYLRVRELIFRLSRDVSLGHPCSKSLITSATTTSRNLTPASGVVRLCVNVFFLFFFFLTTARRVPHQLMCQLLSTFFSLTTLTLFSFSHWITIKPIFRKVILSETVEKRNNLMHSKISAKWSLLCFQSRAWSRGSFGNCHWLAKRIRWFARLQSQEKAPFYSSFSHWFSAFGQKIPWIHVLTMI